MLIALSEAITEPVTIEQAKRHLKIDHDYDDDQINLLIVSGRQYIEGLTGWSLVECDYKWVIERGDVKGSMPIFPASITSDHEISDDGYITANCGDVVLLTSEISQYKSILSQAILLYIESNYNATPQEQEILNRTFENICKNVRRSVGL